MSSAISCLLACLLITAGSAIDCYYSAVRLFPEMELNPLARWIVAHHGVPPLIALKVLGTGIAVSMLSFWHPRQPSRASAVAWIVAGAMVGVASFLWLSS